MAKRCPRSNSFDSQHHAVVTTAISLSTTTTNHHDHNKVSMFIWAIRWFVDDSRWCPEGKGTPTTGVLRAPVGDWWIINAAQSTNTNHVFVKPGKQTTVSKRKIEIKNKCTCLFWKSALTFKIPAKTLQMI